MAHARANIIQTFRQSDMRNIWKEGSYWPQDHLAHCLFQSLIKLGLSKSAIRVPLQYLGPFALAKIKLEKEVGFGFPFW